MTTLTYHLSRALGRAWGPGDEIVVTELDHHANIDPWRALETDRGVTVRTVPLRPETGTWTRRIWSERSRRGRGSSRSAPPPTRSARSTTSGAPQSSRTRSGRSCSWTPSTTRRTRWSTSGRSAAISWRARRTSSTGRTSGVSGGAGSCSSRSTSPSSCPRPTRRPERLETGTLSHEGIVGAAAAVDFLASLAAAPGPGGEPPRAAFTALHARGHALFERLWTVSAESQASPATDRRPSRRARRRSRSWWPDARRTRSPRSSPGARSSSRPATSTPGPSCVASATPRTASCARAVRATRRRTRSIGCWRASREIAA